MLSYVYPPQQLAAVFERVAPRYDASLTLVFRGRRMLYPNSELRLYSTSTDAAIFTEDDDVLVNATETILYTGFNSSAVKDRNDDTYADAVNSIAAGETRDLVKWDLGSIITGYVIAKIECYTSGVYTRVLVSNDDVTYSILCEIGTVATVTRVVKASFRYLKLQVYNSSAGTASSSAAKFYTVEVYPESKKKNILRITSSSPMSKLINIITHGYSSVLEVVWI
jgi:hypothetical protein